MINLFRKTVGVALLIVSSVVMGSMNAYSESVSRDIIDSIKQSSVNIYYHSPKNYGTYFVDGSKRQQFLTYGSGVVVRSTDQATFILTNYHVVANGYKFRIKDGRGLYHQASKIAFDRIKDLALLKIDRTRVGTEIRYSRNLDSLNQGDDVFTIGNPRGYSGTFSRGYISYVGRNTKDLKNLIQLDISLEDGSSGSGVFDSEGKLVGLVVGVDGRIGLAINIHDISIFLKQNEERLR